MIPDLAWGGGEVGRAGNRLTVLFVSEITRCAASGDSLSVHGVGNVKSGYKRVSAVLSGDR